MSIVSCSEGVGHLTISWQSWNEAWGPSWYEICHQVPCNVHIVLNTTTLSTPFGIKSQQVYLYIYHFLFYFYIPMLSIKSQSSPRVTNWYLNASIYHWSKNYWFVHSYKLHCHTQIYYSTAHTPDYSITLELYRQLDKNVGKVSAVSVHHFRTTRNVQPTKNSL